MPTVPDVAGTAALAICESLMLALNDRKILPEHEIVGVLRDAAAAHENDPGTPRRDCRQHRQRCGDIVAAMLHRPCFQP